jgi:iron complex transport system ATP-binding protein
LQADELVLMDQGRVSYQGACTDAATHRALEQLFGHRIEIRALADQWVALPRP